MRLLYDLSGDPVTALRQIHDHHGGKDPEKFQKDLLDEVRELLTRDDFVRPEVIEAIAGAHERADEDTEPHVAGPLGLCLGLNAAVGVALAAKPTGAMFREAAAILGGAATRECFRAFYRLEGDDYRAYDLDAAELHRIGTTSLILRCPLRPRSRFEKGRTAAVKCLLPRYHGAKAILDRTSTYKKDHGKTHLASGPEVLDSTELTITMEFIAGETLAEVLDRRAEAARDRALDQADIEFIRQVGLEICRCLGELAAKGHRHLDLSPSNIIVVSGEDEALKFRLIDFGRNFTLTERVGTSDAFRRAALYVAPELLEDASQESWRCDAYSLGVIMLEAAAKRAIKREDLARELDRLWEGDKPWDGAPEIARIVEELVDEEPTRRLILADTPSADDAYAYLRKLIQQETEVLALYEKQTQGMGFGLLRGKALLLAYKNTQAANLFQAGQATREPVDDTYRDFPTLARWAVLSMACWAVVLTSFVALTAADLDLKVLSPWIGQLRDATGAHFEVGDFWGNFWGRVVALTFGLTAVTYYVNNFSTLSPRRLGTRIGWLSELLMRGTSFLLVFPILLAMVYAPHSWALCAGVGTLLVVLNNFVALRIASRAVAVSERLFTPRSAAGRRFVNDVFKEWWLLMGCYSLAMIAIGLLLTTGKAEDEKVFAVLAIVANIVKLYRTNCVETAPQVRGCLSRAFLTLRRAARLEAEGSFAASERDRNRWRERLVDWWWDPRLAAEPSSPGGGGSADGMKVD
jgi:serine/threonine protein kinase